MTNETNTAVVRTSVESVTTTQGKVIVNKFARFETMDPEAVIRELGGSERGNINRAIRWLNAEGASKGVIAKILGKRFQHVRNVLHQDAVNAAAQAKKQAAAQQAVAATVQVQVQVPVQVPVDSTKTEASASASEPEVKVEAVPEEKAEAPKEEPKTESKKSAKK